MVVPSPGMWSDCRAKGEHRTREWLKDELQGEFLWGGLSLNSAWLVESDWVSFSG